MYLSNILADSSYDSIRQHYEYWYQFMEKYIEFWLPDSELHTIDHCARVLFHALHIADQKGLSDDEKNALCKAAVFHDTRRLDDGIDQGHGRRAAEYFDEYCQENELSFDLRAYYAIYYHDQDDVLGLSKIEKSPDLDDRAILIYQVFKDADAMDRLRLGWFALDTKFLRTEEARDMTGFAEYLIKNGK